MRSTMQDVLLTVASILRHAVDIHGDRTVTTAEGDGRYRTTTYRDLGEQVAQLAHALRGVGVSGDHRVGTFMWNNAEHLAVYLAAPAMGAVLHTLNIRLAPEQIAYIANEAEDQVIVADVSLAAQLAPVLPMLTTVHTILAVGPGDLTPLQNAGKMVVPYTTRSAAARQRTTGPTSTRRALRQYVTPAVRPVTPRGSSTVTAPRTCTR